LNLDKVLSKFINNKNEEVLNLIWFPSTHHCRKRFLTENEQLLSINECYYRNEFSRIWEGFTRGGRVAMVKSSEKW
jgi:hypothetical protein